MDSEKEIGIVGFASFCAGLGLLIFVLYYVYLLILDPPFLYLKTFVYPYPERYFPNMLSDAISLAALAIMGVVAGKIASKGIKLFRSRKSNMREKEV